MVSKPLVLLPCGWGKCFVLEDGRDEFSSGHVEFERFILHPNGDVE